MSRYVTHKIELSSIEISTVVGSLARSLNDLVKTVAAERDGATRQGYIRDIERMSIIMDRMRGLLPDLDKDVSKRLDEIQIAAAEAGQ